MERQRVKVITYYDYDIEIPEGITKDVARRMMKDKVFNNDGELDTPTSFTEYKYFEPSEFVEKRTRFEIIGNE